MNLIHQPTNNFFDKPYLLTKEQKKNPALVFNDFFRDAKLSEARACLLEIVIACTTSDSDEFAEPKQRDHLIHFCKQVEVIFEAAYILASKMKQVS